MPNYNKLTPELAEKLREIVGGERFQYGDAVNADYTHDEMPIYGRFAPEAVCLVKTTEEVSQIMRLAHDNLI